MNEIVYVPGLAELHWYGCEAIRHRRAFPAWPEVDPDEVICHVCRVLVGSSSWD